jgi:hypothetical protein
MSASFRVVRLNATPETEWFYVAAAGGITNTTDVVLAAAAGPGLKVYLTSLQLKNTNATATQVVVKDGSTIIWRGHASASPLTTDSIVFASPIHTSNNTALNIACVTTGAALLVNAQGYIAP